MAPFSFPSLLLLLPILLATLPSLIAHPTVLAPRDTCTVTGAALSVGGTLEQQQTMTVTIQDAAGNIIGNPLSTVILDEWDSGISQEASDESLPYVMEATLSTQIDANNGVGEYTFKYFSWGPVVAQLEPQTVGNALNFTTGAVEFPC